MSSLQFKHLPAVPGLECVHQGKVRDTFAIPGSPNLLLSVATNRVSTHNIVHESEIPYKGEALTRLTVFWMTKQLRWLKTHLVADGQSIYSFLPKGNYPADLHCRAIVIKKLDMIPIEFVFRSRMAGSLWKDYYSKGLPNPYGIDLPHNLQLMSPFAETIFTPTDKSETDDPIDAADTMYRHPAAYQLAREVYEQGRKFAATKGIEIIDGKFEIGIDKDSHVVLADECLTPDSCRFVKEGTVVVGQEPAWLDKQYVREEAERLWHGGGKVPLTFSAHVCAETTRRYDQILQTLTGLSLSDP